MYTKENEREREPIQRLVFPKSNPSCSQSKRTQAQPSPTLPPLHRGFAVISLLILFKVLFFYSISLYASFLLFISCCLPSRETMKAYLKSYKNVLTLDQTQNKFSGPNSKSYLKPNQGGISFSTNPSASLLKRENINSLNRVKYDVEEMSKLDLLGLILGALVGTRSLIAAIKHDWKGIMGKDVYKELRNAWILLQCANGKKVGWLFDFRKSWLLLSFLVRSFKLPLFFGAYVLNCLVLFKVLPSCYNPAPAVTTITKYLWALQDSKKSNYTRLRKMVAVKGDFPAPMTFVTFVWRIIITTLASSILKLAQLLLEPSVLGKTSVVFQAQIAPHNRPCPIMCRLKTNCQEWIEYKRVLHMVIYGFV